MHLHLPALLTPLLTATVASSAPPPTTPSETVAPRRETGLGVSQGALSARFPEVDVEVTSSFAHDHGMMSSIESLKVKGEACNVGEVLQKLVAARKGWTQAGGSSDKEALEVFRHFTEGWYALLPHSGRISAETAPDHLKDMLGPVGYHPPKFGVYPLSDGDKVVVHSFFRTWDGGNHGTQLALEVEAYRISNGALFRLKSDGVDPLRPRAPSARKPDGTRPPEAAIPRPRHLTR